MAPASTSAKVAPSLSSTSKRVLKGKVPPAPSAEVPTAASVGPPLAAQLEADAAEDVEEADDGDLDMDDGTRPSFMEQMAAPAGKGKGRAEDEDEVMLDPDAVGANGDAATTTEGQAPRESSSFLKFGAIKDHGAKKLTQSAKVPIPPHRMTPLKRSWPMLYTPLVEELGLLVRVNPHARRVELKTSKHTKQTGVLPKAIAFLQAFALGFTAEDSLALLRLEDIYIESFEIKDVKTLHGDHLSRAIGRIAGKDGRTRFTIENASRTRIVLADAKIHILGSFQAIKIARDAVCALILGSPPGKVYHGLRTVAARQRERF